MVVIRRGFLDDEGNEITEEEFNRLNALFQQEVDNAYNEIANPLIAKINSVASNDVGKLWMLFDHFTAENMHYDLMDGSVLGKGVMDFGYPFKNYKTKFIRQATKYPALLVNSGVCETFARAFEDLANRLKIPCKMISGDTGMRHAWNVVLIDGQIKHIDVAYALMNRDYRENYFLVDAKDLGNRTITDSIPVLKEEMLQQYKQFHPNDVSQTPQPESTKRHGFNVLSRTEAHRMKVIDRSDKGKGKGRR